MLVESVVGPGKARVNVAADWHQDVQEQLEELWDPTPVIRSQTMTLEGSGGASLAQGIAGTRANLPGVVPPGANEPATATIAPPATATSLVTNPVRVSQVQNNEVSKTTRRKTRDAGGLARLSIAVLVDDESYVEKDQQGNAVRRTRPRSAEQMQKLREAITAGAGFDAARGDQLTVQNIAFVEPPVAEEEPAPGMLHRYAPELTQGLKVLVVLVLGVAALFLVGRPLMRRVATAEPVPVRALSTQLPRTIEEIEGEIAAQLDSAATLSDRRLPVLTRRLTGMAQKDPEVAARLVRTWLVEDNK
jgi:flagellar M-ring protein FliF